VRTAAYPLNVGKPVDNLKLMAGISVRSLSSLHVEMTVCRQNGASQSAPAHASRILRALRVRNS
jgi:hypothetical protein